MSTKAAPRPRAPGDVAERRPRKAGFLSMRAPGLLTGALTARGTQGPAWGPARCWLSLWPPTLLICTTDPGDSGSSPISQATWPFFPNRAFTQTHGRHRHGAYVLPSRVPNT